MKSMRDMKEWLKASKARRLSLFAVVAVAVIIGYNASVSWRSACNAQVVPGPPSITVDSNSCSIAVGFGVCVDPCDPIMTSTTMRQTYTQTFDQLLRRLTVTFPTYQDGTQGGGDDGFIGYYLDLMVRSLLTRLNDLELDMIDWWDTLWWYNLRPAMQAMTRQWNSAVAQQVDNFQAGMDTFQQNETNNLNNKQENKNAQQMRPSENACVAATMSGGHGRQASIAKGMRVNWQYRSSVVRGSNKRGVAGNNSDQGQARQWRDDATEFENYFCDPQDNGGVNVCQANPPQEYRNADTQVTAHLYNKLTLQVDSTQGMGISTKGDYEQRATESIIKNLVGDPTPDPINLHVLQTPQGQEKWMDRRSYLARYNAIRSVPQLIASWRMPGTRLGEWVKEIRGADGAQVPDTEISDNPSYLEVVHAYAVDRFNSGKYANGLITESSEIEMEKLTLSTFYLMELRRRYELFEREALALAVQVSLLSEAVPVANPRDILPMR